jgi:hypothetical protein
VHRNTSLLLLRNLVAAGVVTCSAEASLALNLHRVFMPHVGLSQPPTQF